MKPEILIYDVVGHGFFEGGLTAKSIKEQLDSIGAVSNIDVRIQSPGGDVFEGIAIMNILRQNPADITVYIDGLAASIASVIAMAATGPIFMPDNAQIMIHDPYAFAIGNAVDMRSTADLLDKAKGSIVASYQKNGATDADQLAELMTAETWLTFAEAKNLGFNVEEIDGTAAIVDMAGVEWIKNAPAVVPKATAPGNKTGAVDELIRSNDVDRQRGALARIRKDLRAIRPDG